MGPADDKELSARTTEIGETIEIREILFCRAKSMSNRAKPVQPSSTNTVTGKGVEKEREEEISRLGFTTARDPESRILSCGSWRKLVELVRTAEQHNVLKLSGGAENPVDQLISNI